MSNRIVKDLQLNSLSLLGPIGDSPNDVVQSTGYFRSSKVYSSKMARSLIHSPESVPIGVDTVLSAVVVRWDNPVGNINGDLNKIFLPVVGQLYTVTAACCVNLISPAPSNDVVLTINYYDGSSTTALVIVSSFADGSSPVNLNCTSDIITTDASAYVQAYLTVNGPSADASVYRFFLTTKMVV